MSVDVPADHRDRSADGRRAVGRHRRAWSAAITCISTTRSAPSSWPRPSIRSKVFRASRWGRSLRGVAKAGLKIRDYDRQARRRGPRVRRRRRRRRLSELPDDARASTNAFYAALTSAESATVHDFDKEKFFEGCLPIEVMAHRGTRHAALRADEAGRARRIRAPGGSPYAVVQLRQDNARRRPLQPGRLPDADEVGRAGARAADDPRPRERRVRALRHGAPQHLHQRPDGAAADVADAGRATTCSSRARSPASRATSSRRRPGSLPAECRGPGARRGAARAAARRRRSARWRTTCRTPTRGTISRPTSRSASCRRLDAGGGRSAQGRPASAATSERALRVRRERVDDAGRDRRSSTAAPRVPRSTSA